MSELLARRKMWQGLLPLDAPSQQHGSLEPCLYRAKAFGSGIYVFGSLRVREYAQFLNGFDGLL